MPRLGAALVLLVVLVAVVVPWVSPYDPAFQLLADRLTPPSLAHPLGLDELGRDMLVRIAIGARLSLAVGLSVVAVSASVGTWLGAVAGYRGGWLDQALSRVMDVLLAFPGLLLAIALVAMLGPGLWHVWLALVSIGWVGYARLVRGLVLKLRELDYVQAARALGASRWWIVRRHLVPAVLPAVLVQATTGMAGVMLSEASLSFLGLGVQPPVPSWGTMLSGGRAHILDAPHVTIVPGLAIALLVLGLNLLGDAWHGRLDPRTRRRTA